MPPDLYGPAYFQHYVDMDATPMAARLNEVRVELVRRHFHGRVVDVGIGGGSFIRAHGMASGWDVNPQAIRWLFENGLLLDPRTCDVRAVTLWDSIEHMRDPSDVLSNVSGWVFLSTPIYTSLEHVLSSRHFKPGEHLWYFSEWGLTAYMAGLGFDLVEANTLESELGRDSIGSYAFRRGRD